MGSIGTGFRLSDIGQADTSKSASDESGASFSRFDMPSTDGELKKCLMKEAAG